MSYQQSLFLTNIVEDPMGLFDELRPIERKRSDSFALDSEHHIPVREFATDGVLLALRDGSFIEGKLSFDVPVRIDGRLTGDLHSSDSLVIGESAEVFANVIAQDVEVWGYVKGSVTALGMVVVRAGGCLLGKVQSKELVVEQGAIFEGRHGNTTTL